MSQISAELVVETVLDELLTRGGFDSWWEEIGFENRVDIRTTLYDAVEEYLDAED